MDMVGKQSPGEAVERQSPSYFGNCLAQSDTVMLMSQNGLALEGLNSKEVNPAGNMGASILGHALCRVNERREGKSYNIVAHASARMARKRTLQNYKVRRLYIIWTQTLAEPSLLRSTFE